MGGGGRGSLGLVDFPGAPLPAGPLSAQSSSSEAFFGCPFLLICPQEMMAG